MKKVVAYYQLLDVITLDRKRQFVSGFQIRVTKLFRIKRHLLTAYYFQIDSATKKINSTIKIILRQYVNQEQNNQAKLCSIVQIALKRRKVATTKISPFFLQHRHNVDLIKLKANKNNQQRYQTKLNLKKAAEALIIKFKKTFNFIQSSIAAAQEEQEK